MKRSERDVETDAIARIVASAGPTASHEAIRKRVTRWRHKVGRSAQVVADDQAREHLRAELLAGGMTADQAEAEIERREEAMWIEAERERYPRRVPGVTSGDVQRYLHEFARRGHVGTVAGEVAAARARGDDLPGPTPKACSWNVKGRR